MRAAVQAVPVLFCLLLISWPAKGQQRVSPRQSYERLMAVVPLIGAGTVEDPKRPMFAPAPKSIDSKSRTGIIAYSYVLSDDGKYALCEFVARDRATLNALLAGPAAATGFVSSFLKGAHTQAEVETEFKKYKKDFDINKFGAHVQ